MDAGRHIIYPRYSGRTVAFRASVSPHREPIRVRCSYDEEEVSVFLNNLMGILVPNIPHSVKSVVLAHNLYEFHKPERAHLCHNYKCNYFCSYLKCTARCTITRRHAEISNTACRWWYPAALCTPPTWKVNSIFILGVIGTNRPMYAYACDLLGPSPLQCS